jgi:hypothetical protein
MRPILGKGDLGRSPSVADVLWRVVPADLLADPGTGPPTDAHRGFVDDPTKTLRLDGNVERGIGQRLFSGRVENLVDRVAEARKTFMTTSSSPGVGSSRVIV